MTVSDTATAREYRSETKGTSRAPPLVSRSAAGWRGCRDRAACWRCWAARWSLCASHNLICRSRQIRSPCRSPMLRHRPRGGSGTDRDARGPCRPWASSRDGVRQGQEAPTGAAPTVDPDGVPHRGAAVGCSSRFRDRRRAWLEAVHARIAITTNSGRLSSGLLAADIGSTYYVGVGGTLQPIAHPSPGLVVIPDPATPSEGSRRSLL